MRIALLLSAALICATPAFAAGGITVSPGGIAARTNLHAPNRDAPVTAGVTTTNGVGFHAGSAPNAGVIGGVATGSGVTSGAHAGSIPVQLHAGPNPVSANAGNLATVGNTTALTTVKGPGTP